MASISQSTARMTGVPMASASTACLARSAQNSAGVMRLKPCRASMTNWRQMANGRSIAAETAMTLKMSATP